MSAILCFSKCLDQMAGTNLRHQPSGTLATWDLHFEKSIRGISQSISRWMSLIELAFAGDYDAVVALLDGDLANSAQRDELGHSAFFSAVIGKQLEVCKLLVSRGFDVNEQSSEFGFTLLHKACRAGSFEICKLLVESGADVHVRDPKGSDAIYNTITGSGDLRICQYLVSKGASCDGAFRLACFNGQLKIATWLLDETEKGMMTFMTGLGQYSNTNFKAAICRWRRCSSNRSNQRQRLSRQHRPASGLPTGSP